MIEVRPGGYNSVTYRLTGYSPTRERFFEEYDFTRAGEVSTDTGSRLLSGSEVRRLAPKFCKTAEAGLGAKAELDAGRAMLVGTAKRLLNEEEGSVGLSTTALGGMGAAPSPTTRLNKQAWSLALSER